MVRLSKVVAENENCKLEIFIKFNDKNKPGQNAGMTGRITNRYTEQLFEFFNANEIKVIEYAKELKEEGPIKKTDQKLKKRR